jgi:hypothetical protein
VRNSDSFLDASISEIHLPDAFSVDECTRRLTQGGGRWPLAPCPLPLAPLPWAFLLPALLLRRGIREYQVLGS